jgi:hypothetical protein
MKNLTYLQKKELDKLKKKFPIGTYTKKDSYSIKVVGYKHDGRFATVKMQFSSNPNYGKSFWYSDLKGATRILKEMKLKK